MKHHAIIALALAACSADNPSAEAPRNGLAFELSVLGDRDLSMAKFKVRKVTFEALGPNGDVSVSQGEVLHADLHTHVLRVPPFNLSVGMYQDASVTVEVGPVNDEPSVNIEATIDGTVVHLRSDAIILLEAQGQGFDIEDGPDQIAQLYVHADEWFVDIDIDGLDVSDGEVWLTPTSELAAHDAAMVGIESHVSAAWPNEATLDDDDDDMLDVGDLFEVDLRVNAVGTQGGSETDWSTKLTLDLERLGSAIQGATVVLQAPDLPPITMNESLEEDGEYKGEWSGYPTQITLLVTASSGAFELEIAAPDPGTLETGPTPVQAEGPWTVQWTGARFDEGTLTTARFNSNATPNAGSQNLAFDDIEYKLGEVGEESATLRRRRRVSLEGWAGDSGVRFDVTQRIPEIDVVDDRLATVRGTTRGAASTGALIVRAWPENFDFDAPEAEFQTFAAFDGNVNWMLSLAPGKWTIEAYVDEDGSDSSGRPEGPTQDEPANDFDFTVGPNEAIENLSIDVD